jgi:hypothetical protein
LIQGNFGPAHLRKFKILITFASPTKVILGRRIFGSAQFEELSREIKFHIGRDGSRIDEIDEEQDPLPQKCLQYFLFGIGIVSILQSTTVPALNLAILFVNLNPLLSEAVRNSTPDYHIGL